METRREWPSEGELAAEIDRLVAECRDTCLWFQRRDYHPRTHAERLTILDAIQRRCDVATFKRAARLKKWLSLLYSSASADS